MSFLVDTCAISELIKQRPSPAVAEWFENRILPVDIAVADQWGRLLARHGNIPAVDGLIAATALRHRLTVVTRNEKDFALTGVDLVNPWNE